MPSVFGCVPSGSRYDNVPNELIHRAGTPFLDNHYRGYQYYVLYAVSDCSFHPSMQISKTGRVGRQWTAPERGGTMTLLSSSALTSLCLEVS